MGLAIAAIPISLVTGAVSVLLLLGVLFSLAYRPIVAEVKQVLTSGPEAHDQGARHLHEFGSTDFQASVPVERIEAWLKEVDSKHGRLTGFASAAPQASTQDQGGTNLGIPMEFVIDAKFVSGSAPIRLYLNWESLNKVTLSDLEIDGHSLRGPG